MVVFDVDGVLTDGGIYLGATESGEPVEMKRFDIQDGLGDPDDEGTPACASPSSPGGRREAVRIRADELQVDDLHQDRTANKVHGAHGDPGEAGRSAGTRRRSWATTCRTSPCCGGWRFPPSWATRPATRGRARSGPGRRQGGRGAVREFAEALLTARGRVGGRGGSLRARAGAGPRERDGRDGARRRAAEGALSLARDAGARAPGDPQEAQAVAALEDRIGDAFAGAVEAILAAPAAA